MSYESKSLRSLGGSTSSVTGIIILDVSISVLALEVVGQLVARPNDQPGRPDLRTSIDKVSISRMGISAPFRIVIDEQGSKSRLPKESMFFQ